MSDCGEDRGRHCQKLVNAEGRAASESGDSRGRHCQKFVSAEGHAASECGDSRGRPCLQLSSSQGYAFSECGDDRGAHCQKSVSECSDDRGRGEPSDEEPHRRPSRSHSPAASVDWPMSREEKKNRVLQLYDRDARAANDQLRSGETALDELRKELRRLRQALPPPKKNHGCELDDEDSTPEMTPRPPTAAQSQLNQVNDAVHRAIAKATCIVGNLLEPGWASADEDGFEPHRRAKSEGAPRKEEQQPAAIRKRRRSRPEAPRRVSFADDPPLKHTAPAPEVTIHRQTSTPRPAQERGRAREATSRRAAQPGQPPPPKPQGLMDFI